MKGAINLGSKKAMWVEKFWEPLVYIIEYYGAYSMYRRINTEWQFDALKKTVYIGFERNVSRYIVGTRECTS